MPVWTGINWIEPGGPSREKEYDMVMSEDGPCDECGDLYDCYKDSIAAYEDLEDDLRDAHDLNEYLILQLSDMDFEIKQLRETANNFRNAYNDICWDHDYEKQRADTLYDQAMTIRFLLDKMCS
jgi:hypothetical protein